MEDQNDKDKRHPLLPSDGSKDRQRLYFVGELEHPVGSRISGRGKRGFGSMRQEIQEHEDRPRPSIEPCDGSEDADLLADAELRRRQQLEGRESAGIQHEETESPKCLQSVSGYGASSCNADHCELGNADSPSPSRLGEDGGQGEAQGRLRCGPCNGFWSDSVWLPCRDGKARPTKPGIFPLVDGATKRVGHCGDTGLEVNATPEARVLRLRGYGDAIVAPVAAEFIMAYCSCEQKLCVMRGSEEDDDA